MVVIQSYERGLAGVRSQNPDVRLSVGREAGLAGELVLSVEYPARIEDPAGRDVWCDAENQDWSGGRAISFQVRAAAAERLSVSFFDRNRVVYTTWVDLEAARWQKVRLAFDELRPNPYFQPPDAKTGASLDISEINGIAFAPHHEGAGRLTLSAFVVTE